MRGRGGEGQCSKMTITSIAHTPMYIVNHQEEVKELILERNDIRENAAHKHYMIKYKIAMHTHNAIAM